MSGLKKYNKNGKIFEKDRFKVNRGFADNLLSYEEMKIINNNTDEVKHGFFNREVDKNGDIIYTPYIPASSSRGIYLL